MSETAWKVAREAAAREAAEHSSTHEDAPWTENDAAVARVRSLPMPPAFSAAVEAEMEEVKSRLKDIHKVLSASNVSSLDARATAKSMVRALLSRMEGKR